MGALLLIVIVAIIGAMYLYFRNKRKAEAWQGVVESKDERSITHSDGEDTAWYEIVVKLDSGEFKTIEVKDKIYKQFNKGDRIIKVAGQLEPKKPV